MTPNLDDEIAKTCAIINKYRFRRSERSRWIYREAKIKLNHLLKLLEQRKLDLLKKDEVDHPVTKQEDVKVK